MKIRIVAREESKKKYEEMLLKAGFEISSNASLSLIEDDIIVDGLMGKNNGRFSFIKADDITCIESFGHEKLLHTLVDSFQIKERLYELELILDPNKFIRVNKSTIVNYDMISYIKPAFSMKFLLIMKNYTKVEVTRSYYYKFKEFTGI